jgi:hypothetical protein
MSIDVPFHPVLAALTKDSPPGNPQPQTVVKLSGFVGPASQNGLIRIYSSLSDLSHYLELESDAVVHTTATPATEVADNACSLWVKAGAPVRWTREYYNAGALVTSIASSMAPAASTTGGSAVGT